MEVLLYNSTVCRLCGEENDNGTLLYSCEDNTENLCDVINTYLPIKVSDDGQLPRTICPGCTIQLEATVEFINLIINGQKVIRELHQREKEFRKQSSTDQPDIITEKIVYEINTRDGVYQVEHPISLQVAGLEKPKRKRGRPPKKKKTPEELATEAVEKEIYKKFQIIDEEPSGKRKRKTPERFKEVVQGKELERIFKEEGVIDGEDSEEEPKKRPIVESKPPAGPKEPEVIGHMETSGELVVVVKGKGRGRPRGRVRTTRQKCTICGLEFQCVIRYMSHIAQHGPVIYQCQQCSEKFDTRVLFNEHQSDLGHIGQNIIPCGKNQKVVSNKETANEPPVTKQESPELAKVEECSPVPMNSLPDLDEPAIVKSNIEKDPLALNSQDILDPSVVEINSSPPEDNTPDVPLKEETVAKVNEGSLENKSEKGKKGKAKLKCNFCDKLFSNKQSKSMHIKAVHQGERPYPCGVCGARFAYPRSLAVHAISHRPRRAAAAVNGFACDLCGKVLNHPSSVVYHKEAEHASQRYVCNKCGKLFKHKQLLQRHQLVHSQLRPYPCKVCHTSFKTKTNLYNHQLLHSGIKRYSCEICKQRFAHKTSLTLHMRWHTGQKPYTCGTCGKKFSQKGNLSEHERIHTGEKPYQCKLCQRRFTTSSQHRLHLQRHNAERPFSCTNCDKRFATRIACQLHELRDVGCGASAGAGDSGGAGDGRGAGDSGGTGAGDSGGTGDGAWGQHRPAQGPRSFPDRAALGRPPRRHAPERPHRCPHCPRTFADVGNFNRHKRQFHKQISLLVTDQNQHVSQHELEQVLQEDQDSQLSVVESVAQSDMEENVIYVTYNMEDSDNPQYHILDPEQAANLNEDKVLTTCSLYSGSSLLAQPTELETLVQEPKTESIVLDPSEHIEVTDEEGNPLHFTMQDGTRLAITSVDGNTLQVVTQDGQTIPVEINGYPETEEVTTETIMHHLNLQKSVESSGTHYYTFV